MFTKMFIKKRSNTIRRRMLASLVCGWGLLVVSLGQICAADEPAAAPPTAVPPAAVPPGAEPATDRPASDDTRTGKFELHDLSLWVFDPGHPQANARNAFGTALPVTVTTVRSGPQTPAARRVAPIGLITFHGEPTTNLDIDLRTKAGGFLAHWPPGDSLPNRLRWSGTPSYDLVAKVDGSELMYVDGDHWINQARTLGGLYLKRGARSERFLAYDVELNLTTPIRLEGGPDKYKVINLTSAPLYDVLISRSTPEGRRVAWIDVLPKGEGAAPNAPAQPAPAPAPGQPAQPQLNLFSDAAEKPQAKAPAVIEGNVKARQAAAFTLTKPVKVAAPAAGAGGAGGAGGGGGTGGAGGGGGGGIAIGIAAGAELAGGFVAAPEGANPVPAEPAPGPAAKPNGKPAEAKLFGGLAPGKISSGVEVTLSAPLAVKSAELSAETSAELLKRLVKAGLSEDEARMFADHYASVFFEGDALVVACRLEPAVLDEKLPLSVFPAPAKTVRVPIVVMRNADPQLGQQIEALIAELGSPKFQTREQAHQKLLEFGALAVPALNKAATGSDLEIVIRAERILLQQNQTPGATGAAGRVLINGVVQPVLAAPAIRVN